MRGILTTIGCVATLVLAGCAQAPTAVREAGPSSPATAAPTAAAPVATAIPATPVPATPAPPPPAAVAPAPPPPAPAPAPVSPAISLAVVGGNVTVYVAGIASGGHEVHIHRDCSGNPNLHLTTLGTIFVNGDGSGARTFAVSPSLRSHGFDLLVYPLGASQGPPVLCSAV
jgi:hypothetical protein